MSTTLTDPHSAPEPDDFERGLASRRFRTVPPEWRDAILGAATSRTQAAAPVPESVRNFSPSSPIQPTLPWWDWLGSGWSVAAAIWVLILGLHQYSGGSLSQAPRHLPPLSPNAEAFLDQLQREARGLAMGQGPAGERTGSIDPADRPRRPRRAPRAGFGSTPSSLTHA